VEFAEVDRRLLDRYPEGRDPATDVLQFAEEGIAWGPDVLLERGQGIDIPAKIVDRVLEIIHLLMDQPLHRGTTERASATKRSDTIEPHSEGRIKLRMKIAMASGIPHQRLASIHFATWNIGASFLDRLGVRPEG